MGTKRRRQPWEPKDRPPELVRCATCGRELFVEQDYGLPDARTPRDLVSYVYDTVHPPFGVQCPGCGHYTVFSRLKGGGQ
jgi:ribosomal protein S27E